MKWVLGGYSHLMSLSFTHRLAQAIGFSGFFEFQIFLVWISRHFTFNAPDYYLGRWKIRIMHLNVVLAVNLQIVWDGQEVSHSDQICKQIQYLFRRKKSPFHFKDVYFFFGRDLTFSIYNLPPQLLKVCLQLQTVAILMKYRSFIMYCSQILVL